VPKKRADLTKLQQQITQRENVLGVSEEKQVAAELALQSAEPRIT
jgi:hypothetical protein